ncbi:hypothetical protein [Luteipulveratus halotolerans]|uniref:Secreted protein n=1 Tax=Luteipulveratus halotolerans TaxID=1631356 RepID=A0A0L6CJ86_9MICO|nr:hypothetical protein [Luteipulveratus halotolerans]KNX37563.1 hypothetical protein VV01_11035 [Luteipulveratus halotolerans]
MKRTLLSIAAAGLIGVGMVSGADAGSASTATVSGGRAVVHVTDATTSRVTAKPRTSAPSAATKAAITRAVERSPLLGEVPPTGVVVTAIRVSTRDARWASALVAPKSSDVDPAQVVLRHTSKGWSVRDLGTDQVGCQVLKAKVRTELGLWGRCAV